MRLPISSASSCCMSRNVRKLRLFVAAGFFVVLDLPLAFVIAACYCRRRSSACQPLPSYKSSVSGLETLGLPLIFRRLRRRRCLVFRCGRGRGGRQERCLGRVIVVRWWRGLLRLRSGRRDSGAPSDCGCGDGVVRGFRDGLDAGDEPVTVVPVGCSCGGNGICLACVLAETDEPLYPPVDPPEPTDEQTTRPSVYVPDSRGHDDWSL